MRRYAGRRNGGVSEQYKACCRCKISISGKEIARRIAVKITPSCCLSEKWRIINLLDDIWMLLPRSNHWEKLEEGRMTSGAAEFGIAHSIVSRLWRQFQTTRTAIRGFSRGRPRGTTPADDRYIVLQARRKRRQTEGEIARHTTQSTGRPILRFTVARRLHGGGLFARRSVRYVPLTPAHRRRRSLWCREHRNWRDNEWRRVLFTDESRFSLSSDSHRILIWRERGSRNHLSNIIERDRYGGCGVLVWGGIMLGSRTGLHIFDAGSVNGTRYCNEILLPYVRLFRGAMGLQFLFMDDNAPCHRTVAAEQLLEQTLGSSYLTTSNDSGASMGRYKTNGQQCLNNSLTPSFSAWADAVKPA
ncbi:transposable element Tcb1 transposase [Trichonephila clavipes]|nr:transposable element Tcb1 transposase [Trichonephila clavipes]